MKKSIWSAVLLLAGVAFLFAGGDTDDASTEAAFGEIGDISGEVFEVYGYRDFQNDAWFTDYKEGLERFKADYPGVEFKTRRAGRYGYDTDLIVAVASGNPWDLQYTQSFTYYLAVLQGLYTDLTPYIDWSDPYFEKYEDINRLFDYSGKIYAITTPANSDAFVLMYDAEIWEETGLKTPMEYFEEGNWTYEFFEQEIVPALRKDTDGDGVIDQFPIATHYFHYSNPHDWLLIQDDNRLKYNVNEEDVFKLISMGQAALQGASDVEGATYVIKWQSTNGFFNEEALKPFAEGKLKLGPLMTLTGKREDYVSKMNVNGFAVPSGAKNVPASIKIAQYVTEAREMRFADLKKSLFPPEEAALWDDLMSVVRMFTPGWPGVTSLYSHKGNKDSYNAVMNEGKSVSTHVQETLEMVKQEIETFNENYIR
jgi:ABC-type glycerol-3-phosphate transport system substrate-binding protein